MKKTALLLRMVMVGITFFLFSCSSNSDKPSTGNEASATDNGEYKPEESAASASDPMNDIGIGPVKEKIALDPVDANKASIGKDLFESKCTSCHKYGPDKYVGPGLQGVTERRRPEWIMNQILNPAEMTANDPIAKELLATYLTQMTNQNVTVDQARNILEYFRQQDAALKSK